MIHQVDVGSRPHWYLDEDAFARACPGGHDELAILLKGTKGRLQHQVSLEQGAGSAYSISPGRGLQIDSGTDTRLFRIDIARTPGTGRGTMRVEILIRTLDGPVEDHVHDYHLEKRIRQTEGTRDRVRDALPRFDGHDLPIGLGAYAGTQVEISVRVPATFEAVLHAVMLAFEQANVVYYDAFFDYYRAMGINAAHGEAPFHHLADWLRGTGAVEAASRMHLLLAPLVDRYTTTPGAAGPVLAALRDARTPAELIRGLEPLVFPSGMEGDWPDLPTDIDEAVRDAGQAVYWRSRDLGTDRPRPSGVIGIVRMLDLLRGIHEHGLVSRGGLRSADDADRLVHEATRRSGRRTPSTDPALKGGA